MEHKDADTICALATPPGRSAIAVIRISGNKAAEAPGIFDVPCPEANSFSVCRLKFRGKVVDQVIILFMNNPHSSTGEDVCEIHCHGSQAVINLIMEALLMSTGVRMADPGEFTRRSFLNGKMDLSGVEGLADLIDAETPAQLYQAWAQIDGKLRAPVTAWRAELIKIASQLEALIDFIDEDLPPSIEKSLRKSTKLLITALAENLDDKGRGELVRDGVVVALIGPVNSGKSTILNELVGREAAIVSNLAGTTRDIIQAQIDINGIPTTILDTAGVRDTNEPIESEGIKRAVAAASIANLILVILDGSDKNWQYARASIDDVLKGFKKQRQTLYVLNKADQGIYKGSGKINPMDTDDMTIMSAKNSVDISTLRKVLTTQLIPLNKADGSVIITRQRHRLAIQVAHDALKNALKYNFRYEPELAAEEFRGAAVALGRITGEIDVEELLGSIFSAFCIGK